MRGIAGTPGRKAGEDVKSTSARPNAVVTPVIAPWTFTSEQLLAHFTPGKTPRPQQQYVLERIAAAYASGKRAVVAQMPTGSGKTDSGKTVANILREHGRTFMLTSQKVLMDQYTSEFKSPDIEDIKGRANYACTHADAEDGQHAGDGVCRRKSKGILSECLHEDAGPIARAADISTVQAAVSLALPASCHFCPYWAQLQKTYNGTISLFNFSSFLFQQRIGRFPKRALMIIDEAHNCETQLMNFVSLELTEWMLSIIDVRIDQPITSKAQFIEWMREADIMKRVTDRLKDCDEASDDVPEDLTQAESDALKELDGKLSTFLAYLDKTEWIIEVVQYEDRRSQDRRKKIVARPLYAKDFAQDLLFKHADRLLFMSATILDVDVWARNLGLARDEVEFIEVPCDFPVENRLIYKEYCGNFGYKYFSREMNPKDPTQPKFVRKVSEILERHKGQRGIIHCHSFSLSKILFNEIDTQRLLFQDHFSSKEEMLKEHGNRKDSVIVAPAMHEGLSLDDELSRFAIIAKMPWPNMQDQIVKERMSRDPAWFSWSCSLKLVQSYGRSIRSKKDFATTYILDAGFEAFLFKNGRILPDWFKEALRLGAPKEILRG